MLIRLKAKRTKDGFIIPLIEELKNLEEIGVEIKFNPKSLGEALKKICQTRTYSIRKRTRMEKGNFRKICFSLIQM